MPERIPEGSAPMYYIFVGVIVLLLLYTARLAERNGARINVLAKSLDERFQTNSKVLGQDGVLGYEWHEDGWPQVYSDDLLPQRDSDFENPAPYYFQDAYSEGLLSAEYKGAVTALEKKNFLKRILRTGVSVPLAIADEAFNDKDAAVRIYAASHLELVYKDYTGSNWENPPILRDFVPVIANDPDPVVRAARFTNPSHVWWPWTHVGSWILGPHDFWQKTIAEMSQVERLAAMRNPQLTHHFLVALMEEKSDTLNMSTQEHVALICAAAMNPRIVDGSRRTGRDSWRAFDDYNPPFKEYGKMWRLAVDRWLETAVPYRVLKYVQTTPEVKLEVFRRLSEQKHAHLRQEILKSCEPMKDKEILKLGWSDPDEECRGIARKRTGPYVKWLEVKPEKIRIRHYSSEKEEVEVS
jgi:hypothetical protein